MDEQAPDATGISRVAEVATECASRYLQQLARHFRHKVPASFDRKSAKVSFPAGDCRMEAREGRLKLWPSRPPTARP